MKKELDRVPPERVVDQADLPFWEAIDKGSLVLARCSHCRTYYTRSQGCTACGAGRESLAWVAASGKGRVKTFAVFHRAYHPFFRDKIPYNVAVVTLEEGAELVTNVIGCTNEEIAVGMPVRIVSRDRCGSKIHQAKVMP